MHVCKLVFTIYILYYVRLETAFMHVFVRFYKCLIIYYYYYYYYYY